MKGCLTRIYFNRLKEAEIRAKEEDRKQRAAIANQRVKGLTLNIYNF